MAVPFLFFIGLNESTGVYLANIPIDQIFKMFLLSTSDFRSVILGRKIPKLFNRDLTVFKFLAVTCIKRGIASFTKLTKIGIFKDIISHYQSMGKGIHSADMCMKQIYKVGRISSDFCIKIQTAGFNSSVIK